MTAGWWRMTRTLLRTGWRTMAVWWAVCVGLVVATFVGVQGLYPTEQARTTYAATMGRSTAQAALNGRGHDLATLGGIGSFEVGMIGQLLLPVAAILLAVRHSRQQEEAGLVELVTAHRAGRLTPLVAGALTTWAVVLLVGDHVKLGLLALGLPADGAVCYAVTLTAMTWFFACLGLLAAEVCQSARTATSIALGLLGVAYLVRAVVDGLASDAVWASPLGWLAEARPWGADRSWVPALAYLVVGTVLTCAAVGVRLRRDLGAGVVAPRPGPARGAPRTATVLGLPWVLTRGGFIGWTVGALAWSVALGALAEETTRLLRDNPSILAGLGVDRPSDLLSTMVGVLVAGTASLAGAGVAGRLHAEEESGRLGAVLAGRTPRLHVVAGWVVVAVAQSLAILVLGMVAYGVCCALATDDRGALTGAAQMTTAYALPVALVVLVAFALHAVWPPAAVVSWVPAAWVLVVGLLAEPLRLPAWARHLSPVEAVGRVPVDPPSAAALGTTAVLVALTLTVVCGGVSRRDLRSG